VQRFTTFSKYLFILKYNKMFSYIFAEVDRNKVHLLESCSLLKYTF